MINIGILSTFNSPLLSMLINQLNQFSELNFHVLIDRKGLKKNDLDVWRDRTNGKLDKHLKPLIMRDKDNFVFKNFLSHNDENCIEYIKINNISWIVNCGTPRKISSDFLASFKNKVINIHPGILPKYRGSCCVEWALYNGDKVGNTIHIMTQEYDEGPIILKESYDIKKNQNYTDIRVLIYENGIKLLCKLFDKFQNDKNFHIKKYYKKTDFVYKPIPKEKLQLVKDKYS